MAHRTTWLRSDFPACAISISEGTGFRSFNFVGAKGIAFLPLDDMEAPFFLMEAFFRVVFFFGKACLALVFVAI